MDPLREELQAALGTSFTLERELGGGGMSRVFLAEETRFRRRVVLKVLAPELAAALSIKRFEREIAIAAALQHPHVLAVITSGDVDGLPWYSMPFVEGETLRERLADGALRVSEAIAILRDMARALRYAHARGIVHRDIKPENVLLSAGTAVVADFGIAKALRASLTDAAATNEHTALTGTGMSLGTPAYMAPEQAVGEDVDARADLYAWGVVAYEMLAHRHPFAERKTAQQLVVAHLTETPTDLFALGATLPPELSALVMRCLAKDPKDRPASAEELLDVLDGALATTLGARAPQPTGSGSGVAPRPALPAPARLPASVTPLVGRERDVRAIVDLLDGDIVRLLTLHGPGGIGKTRLAIAVASHLQGRHRDGVYFVGLAETRTADAFVARVALALGQRGAEVGSADALRELLRDRMLLLVLDNFEQLVEEAAVEVAALLAECPGVTALVTSQVLLHVYGEHDYPVDALPLPTAHDAARPNGLLASPAVQLFVQRATAARRDFQLGPENAAAVSAICAALDGVPLAIELAAARIRQATPTALLGQIRSSLDVLSGGTRDAPARQRTMRAAVAWAHEGLTDEERRLFRRLSVFESGATPTDVAAICAPDLPIERAEELLVSLADHSLLRVQPSDSGPARFQMLRPIRSFAAESLALAGERDATEERRASVFAALAAEAEPHVARGDLAWLDRLDTDHDNLRAVLDRFERAGDTAAGVRMALHLWRFWDTRSYAREGLDRFRRLLAMPFTDEEARLRLSALFAAGVLADSCGEYELGRRLFEEHLALTERLGDARGTMVARNNLAILLLRQERFDDAIPLFEASVAAMLQIGDVRAAAMGTANVGNAELGRGNHAAARARYKEALRLFQSGGDQVNVAWALSHLGDVSRDESDTAGAERWYRDALAAFRGLSHRRGMASVLVDLAELELARGSVLGARAMLEEALVHVADLGDQRGMLRVLEVMASLAAAAREDESAVRIAAAVAGLRGALGAPLSNAEQARLVQRVDGALARLGSRGDAAWRDGLAMTIDEVLRLVGMTGSS